VLVRGSALARTSFLRQNEFGHRSYSKKTHESTKDVPKIATRLYMYVANVVCDELC